MSSRGANSSMQAMNWPARASRLYQSVPTASARLCTLESNRLFSYIIDADRSPHTRAQVNGMTGFELWVGHRRAQTWSPQPMTL